MPSCTMESSYQSQTARAGGGDGVKASASFPSLDSSSAASSSTLMTQTQATFSIIKGVAGAGIFALPFAFSQAGLLGGVLGVTLLAFLSASSIKLLVRVKRRVFGSHAVTYLDVAERVLGEEAGRLVTVAVVACSLGVSTAYLDFIRCMGMSLLPAVAAVAPSIVFLLPVLPIIIALCLLRSYRLLSFTAAIGDASIALGALCVVVYGIAELSASAAASSPSSPSPYWPHPVSDLLVKPATFPLFLSTAAFLFAVHFFILPIESNMAEPRLFSAAVDRSFLITAAANTAFGVLGLLCFSSPASIVLDNVRGGAVVSVVKLLLCVDLLFSYAVVFFPAREIVENALLGRDSPPSSPPLLHAAGVADSDSGDSIVPASVMCLHTAPLPCAHHVRVTPFSSPVASSSSSSLSVPRSVRLLPRLSLDGQRNGIRIVLVLFTAFLALCLPMFSIVVSLVGGLSMTALGFVFPPLMAIRLARWKREAQQEEARFLLDDGEERQQRLQAETEDEGSAAQLLYWGALIVFGVVVMLLTVVTSAMSVLQALQSDAPISSC